MPTTSTRKLTDPETIWKDKILPDPHPSDIIILIMGITGSGKSTLINTLTSGPAKLHVGYGMETCTKCIEPVVISHPKASVDRIVLLDTPGLNSADVPDYVIVKRIADWIQKCYATGIKLAGVIFLYDINQKRELSLACKNLTQLESLCGEAATKNVLLLTTKWASPPREAELQRENELLKREVWGQLVRQGYRMCRLEESTYDAGWKVVELSLVDAFTLDTAKLINEVRVMKQKKEGRDRQLATLETLLQDQAGLAQNWKNGEAADSLWSQLVTNDRKIRNALREIDVPVPLLQKLQHFFHKWFKKVLTPV